LFFLIGMPTHLVRKWVADLAKRLRNQEEYDDWAVGMEPIPGDRTWCKQCKKCTCRIEGKKEEQ